MAEAQRDFIEVEVVYALPQTQTTVTLTVPAGTTVREALALSGIAARHPELDLDAVPVGIFGRRVAAATVLGDHDRIEIYRPLLADSHQARRRRPRQRVSQGR